MDFYSLDIKGTVMAFCHPNSFIPESLIPESLIPKTLMPESLMQEPLGTLSAVSTVPGSSSFRQPLRSERAEPVATALSLAAPVLSAQQLIAAQTKLSRTLKRSGDLAFSLAVLGLGSPLFLLLAALVRISSPGPVFYVQRRIGRGYREFGCIKFRTMRPDADRLLGKLLAQSPELKAEFNKDFKLKSDPRITPIGRFLRRSSLDELPQFLNVLKGDMSLVGPRPIVRAELSRYGRRMDEVLAVRPGLSGLWQVSGRNNLSYSTRVKLDVSYARHRSVWLDLAIIVRTVSVILFPRDRGAY